MQRRHTVDVLSLTTWQMVFGSVPLIIARRCSRTAAAREWTVSFVWGLVYTVVLANAVAWFLWLYALHALPAGAAGLGTLSIPVVGVVAAWIQLGEVPTLVEGIGMAPHHRRARGARRVRAARRPPRHGRGRRASRTCARSPTDAGAAAAPVTPRPPGAVC